MDKEDITEKMNAKSRRAVNREHKKKLRAERDELLKKIPSEPPSLRLSMFGTRWEKSTEMDWNYYPGQGWVHAMEEGEFKTAFRECELTKKWYMSHYMVVLVSGGVAHIDAVEKAKMVRDAHSGYYMKPEDGFKVHIKLGVSGLIHIHSLEQVCRKCDHSGEWWIKGRLIQVMGGPSGKWVAPNFVDRKTYSKCDNCGRIFDATQVKLYADVGHYECISCHDTRVLGTLIRPHNDAHYPERLHTSPKFRIMQGGEERIDEHGFPYFVGKRKMTTIEDPYLRLFGVEAETEISAHGCLKDGLNRFKLARNVLDTLGTDFVIIKEDGTLTANQHYSKGTGMSGFEIVTCPADLATQRERWSRIINMEGYKHFRAWDEYDTCGLHVHVSRAPLSNLQIGRMLMFINHKANQKFIFRVAGRGSDRYCRYIPKEPSDKTHPVTDVMHVSERVISKTEEGRRDRGRRVALNLSNKNTVEFRIFRGTMNPRHILRNVEFCDAVCDFCYPSKFSINAMADYKVFIDFVSSQKKKWPLFAEWLVNQKLMELKMIKDREKAQMDKVTLRPESVQETERKKSEVPQQEPSLIFTPNSSSLILGSGVLKFSSLTAARHPVNSPATAKWISSDDNGFYSDVEKAIE